MKKIYLKAFSRYPAGRYLSDGPFSGEKFLNDCLLPYINREEKLQIDFDGVRGCGSSFLEEAFGGLVRKVNKKNYVSKKLAFVSKEDPFLISEVESYIRDAEKRLV